MKKYLLVAAAALTVIASSFADDEQEALQLRRQLWEAAGECNLDRIKVLVAKGANTMIYGDNGYSVFTFVAEKTLARERNDCRESARYLSSLGVSDSGHYTMDHEIFYAYEKPLVYESAHLKITVAKYKLGGALIGTLENKTDDTIHLLGFTHTVNDKKFSYDWKTASHTGRSIEPSNGKPVEFELSFHSANPFMYPRIVNNRLTITRTYNLSYLYKDKMYNLKIPKTTQEIAVNYDTKTTIYFAAAAMDKATVDKELWKAAVDKCDYLKTKELVEKGGNINQKKGEVPLFNYVAAKTSDQNYEAAAHKASSNCREVAHYLSSIGAKDDGRYTGKHKIVSTLKEPRVYETQHLRMIITGYSTDGSAVVTLENIAGHFLEVKSYTAIVNGEKSTGGYTSRYQTSYLIMFEEKKNESIYSRPVVVHDDYSKYPKVVNNKVKFTAEYAIAYEYKGKTYELKTPKITHEIDIKYNYIPPLFL
jgi:hypothetical protein